MAKFQLKTTLSVLEDLGINNYSNAAAVLSEIVANAWDADAEAVWIDVKGSGKKRVMTIEDSGVGMKAAEVNAHYLKVGYKRRESSQGGVTRKGRRVMGRKGIGKLAVFSIAKTIEVHTVSGSARNAFKMDLDVLRAKAKSGKPYYPEAIKCATDLSRGTRIVLRDIDPSLKLADKYLRRHLSRRFTVIDGSHDFEIVVNGKQITLADRDYYGKLQYLWHYGMPQIIDLAKNAKKEEGRGVVLTVPNSKGKASKCKVSGWIGSAETRRQLSSEDDENLNRLSLVVRGKLAHENLLDEFSEGGVYASYLIGEIHADFLDADDRRDIATSSRQRIIEDDPRYVALKNFLQKELKHIESSWTAMRNQQGAEQAKDIPAIREWYNALTAREQKIATMMLGRVNTLPIDIEDRRTFFKQAVLAFEAFRVKQNLDALESMTGEQVLAAVDLFQSVDDIEAANYLNLVKQRVAIIDALERLVDENQKEEFLKRHIFKYLWLLNTAWEHATEYAVMEKSVMKMISEAGGKGTTTLSKEIQRSRVDIRYRLVGGRHVIIELKRAEVKTNTADLLKQVQKYAAGMRNLLADSGKPNEPFEIVILVGKQLSDWSDYSAAREDSAKTLAHQNARVMLYDEVLSTARGMYAEFISKARDASKIADLLESIEESEMTRVGIVVPGKKVKSLPKASTMRAIVRRKKIA